MKATKEHPIKAIATCENGIISECVFTVGGELRILNFMRRHAEQFDTSVTSITLEYN